MKKIALMTLIFLSACSFPASAQQACTQMWCQEGLNMTLNTADWPSGAYTFTITADGQETICTSRLPFVGCDGNTVCNGPVRVTIGESGCAMGPETHGFYALMMDKPPRNFGLTIARDNGEKFIYGPVAVNPQCSYPNGKECDPSPCCSANLSADVAWE